MKKNLFFFLTPCVIAAVGLFVMITDSFVFLNKSKGDSYMGIIMPLPFLVFYIIADYILRKIFKRNLVAIWVIEILLIVLSGFLFWNYFPFKEFKVKH
jgi:hypothetical protein